MTTVADNDGPSATRRNATCIARSHGESSRLGEVAVPIRVIHEISTPTDEHLAAIATGHTENRGIDRMAEHSVAAKSQPT